MTKGARYLTPAQARFYVEHLGADFSDYQREHDVYQAQLRLVVRTLELWGRYQIIERSFLPNFMFGPADIVVALGQDGVIANTMKYLDGHPLIGVNPDTGRYDGILLPFVAGDLPALLREVASDARPDKTVIMAKAILTDGRILHAVNDLFVGARSHTSAIYEIGAGAQRETQSSSGIIIATGLGSTAWFKSIVTDSLAIASAYGSRPAAVPYEPQPWDSAELHFAVREPFPSRTSQTNLICGRVTPSEPLLVRSLMPENGVIFSDGIEADRLDFHSGTEVRVTVADRKGRLVV